MKSTSFGRAALVVALLSLGLSACSGVHLLDTYGKAAIDRYCSAVEEEERLILRDRFNEEVAPHEVQIFCGADESA